MPSNSIISFASVIVASALFACTPGQSDSVTKDKRPVADKFGTVFSGIASITEPVNFTEIDLLKAQNQSAVWGATGRDIDGYIYFGVSSPGSIPRTGYLYQFDPVTNKLTSQSDVLTELKRAGRYEESVGQNKLHSKIVQAADGYLYFSSFDEKGEALGKNPTSGGNLWRKKPSEEKWEHLLATNEALIAVNTTGRYVYALGYWDHVLYQFDPQTATSKQITIGSTGKHTSRHLLVNLHGHVFVPHVYKNQYDETEAYLVEYDHTLNEVARFPFPRYVTADMDNNHGIIAYSGAPDGSVYFVTHKGYLFQLEVDEQTQTTRKKIVGRILGNKDSYASVLYVLQEGKQVVMLTRSNKGWFKVIYDVANDSWQHSPIAMPNRDKGFSLFYGTQTRSNNGNAYVVGTHRLRTPLIFSVTL